jgi:hypothetical protein
MFVLHGSGYARRRAALRGAALALVIAAATGILLGGATPCRADGGKGAAGTANLDTEHLFGFTEGSDIGDVGERELESDTTLRSGKVTGAFNDTASQLEFKYTAFENFRISAAATFAYYDIAGVTGMDDRHDATLQSLSLDARYRFLDHERAPFGMTLSLAPHWGFADETSGVPHQHFGLEADLLFDRALVPDLLFGAMNVHFDTDRTETATGGGPDQQPTVGVFLALAGQAMPGVWIGGEARYFRAYEGAGLETLTGQALYLGPTLYAKLGEKLWLSVAFDAQARGRAISAPGALDLVNFERYQANLRLGFEF